MGWRCRRKGTSDGRSDRREAAEARRALVRCAHRGEGRLLESVVGPEARRLLTAPVHERDDDSLRKLTLAELHVQVALHDLERRLRGREERLLLRRTEPERPA